MPINTQDPSVIYIHRNMQKEKTDNFLLIKRQNFFAACRSLTPTALILYLYIAANKDGYHLALNPKSICTDLGITYPEYLEKQQELITKGYLIQDKDKSYVYHFYEEPLPSAA